MAPNSMYSCLWFNDNGAEAADFYCKIFPNSKVLQRMPMVTLFNIHGTKFMGLDGGDKYRTNSAISYYVYCGNEGEVDRLFDLLKQDGKVLLPLDSYDWTDRYAWVEDRFGVNWQLDSSEIKSPQKIVPSLLFANAKKLQIKDALGFYAETFTNTRILLKSPLIHHVGAQPDNLRFAQFELNGFVMNAISSEIDHDFDFTPGNSFVIECANQAEIDYFWQKLGEGGRYSMCGWLTDAHGVSWQVVPSILPKLLSNPEKGERVLQAYLQMQRFDIDKLMKA